MEYEFFERKIDEFGRIAIPAEFLDSLDKATFRQSVSDDGRVILTLDSNGKEPDWLRRVLLPRSYLIKFSVNHGDAFSISKQDNAITLEKIKPACIFTGRMDDLIEYRGKTVSRAAVIELAARAGLT